ncbi:MAG: trigger factor [Flavobacteriales bacterium]|jgi:trigger factor|nr:trigger factor [Flavobacteriales bacterium]HJN63655.1 trigger factor [Flavobacteriales bacterium]|tara:strand:- start:1911 stop:3266 length:1356 start_codon:yes stop_codon:yes gene_type:complete
MKITQSKTKDLMATLKVEVVEKDYRENVDKILKDYRKTAVMPGFRKGKTPMSIINKKYKTAVTVEEVNKILQDEMYKHISENKVKVLGSPMPKKNEKAIDWEKDNDFSFEFEIGLAPDFDVKITKKDKLNYYNIKAGEKLLNNYCNDIAKRYGKMGTMDVSEEGDLVFCNIEQLDVDGNVMENGIKNEATVSMDFIADKKIKKQFVGVKSGDTFKINVIKAFTNHSDLGAMLNVKHEAIHNLSSEKFQFTVKNINRLTQAELDVELFDKVYGQGTIKTLKEFRAKIKEEAEMSFVAESDRMLKNDVVSHLLEKNKFDIPDDFLKRWLVQTSEQPITLEQIESEYDMYSKSLKWQLIENKVNEKYDIKIEQEEIITHAKNLISGQMMQYGQPVLDDEKLTEMADSILKKEEERKKIIDQIYDQKSLVVYKANFKLTDKDISYDDFVKLASEK